MHDLLVKQPIFLVGAERSGTTLLRLMLAHNSQLAWCNEFEYVVDLISNEGYYPQLEVYYEWLGSHRIFQDTNFEIDASLDYLQLVNSFLIQKQVGNAKQFVGATVHRHFDKLLPMWSQAKFIHIIRDGRDVSRSCINMGWAGNVWTGVERWIEAENLWEDLSKSLSRKQKIEITYESLISQPTQTLEAICDFIGVPFEAEMLNYHENTSYSPPDPKLIQQWKNKLSQREIQLVESRISSMLLERNYKLSGFPLIEVTPLKKRVLKIQDWFERVKFRVNRFGLSLFLADYFSRLLQINSWQKNIKLKKNAIQRLYIK